MEYNGSFLKEEEYDIIIANEAYDGYEKDRLEYIQISGRPACAQIGQ